MLGLRCYTGSPLVAANRGYPLVAVCEHLILVVSLAAEHKL